MLTRLLAYLVRNFGDSSSISDSQPEVTDGNLDVHSGIRVAACEFWQVDVRETPKLIVALHQERKAQFLS